MGTAGDILSHGEESARNDRRFALVLVGDEDAFIDLFQRFPPRKYPMVFVQPTDDLLEICTAQQPRLLILSPSDFADESGLLQLLRRARGLGTQVIGLTDEAAPPNVAKLLTRTHQRSDIAGLLKSAAELLGERRAMPRVQLQLELSLVGVGEVTASVISARSLFIPQCEPLKTGQLIQLCIRATHGDLRGWASVVRVCPGESESAGLVLGIPERERDLRAYLGGLVRGALLLDQAEIVETDPRAALPEKLSQRLIERLTQQVSALQGRLDSQLALTESLGSRLDELTAAEQKAVKWQDVRPVLAQKWSAQRELIKKLVARVDALAVDHQVGRRLQETLESEQALQDKIEQQGAMIEALRARVDELADAGEQRADLVGARQEQAQIDEQLGSQTRLINELSARIEMLSLRGAQSPLIDQSRKTLEDHSVQIASLSLRVDVLCDQIRLGHVDEDALNRLRADIEHRQAGLSELRRPVAQLEAMSWGDSGASHDTDISRYEEDVPTSQKPESYASLLLLTDKLGGTGATLQGDGEDESTSQRQTETTEGAEYLMDETEASLSDQGRPLIFPDSMFTEGRRGAQSQRTVRRRRAGAGPARRAGGLQPSATWEDQEDSLAGTVSLRQGRSRQPKAPEPSSTTPDAPGSRLAHSSTPSPEPPLTAPPSDKPLTTYPSGNSLPGRPWRFYVAVMALTLTAAGLTVAGIARLSAVERAVADDRPIGEIAPDSAPLGTQDRQLAEPTASASAQPANAEDASSMMDLGVEHAPDGGERSAAVAASTTQDPQQDEPLADSQGKDAASAGASGRSNSALAHVAPAVAPGELRRRDIKSGMRLLRQRKYKACRQHLTKALAIRDDHRVRWLLGRAHHLAGELWPAIHHYNKALATSPARLLTYRHDVTGQAYLELGKPVRACEHFRAALTAKPSDKRAALLLAQHCK